LGYTPNYQTAAADLITLFFPVFVAWIMRRKRGQGAEDSTRLGSKKSRGQGFK
jgi:hypothetical protein